MSGAMREKNSSDYDLERFVDMFDQALISDDPRIKNALRQLMMMVILTDSGDHEAESQAKQITRSGPLRRMQEDMREQIRWIQRLEGELESIKREVLALRMPNPTTTAIKIADNTSTAYNSFFHDTNSAEQCMNNQIGISDVTIKI